MAAPLIPTTPEDSRLTVGLVRVQSAGAEVMFHQSARIYRLPRQHPDYERLLVHLQKAARMRTAVDVTLGGAEGDEVLGVTPAH
jgi:hypothetical protein